MDKNQQVTALTEIIAAGAAGELIEIHNKPVAMIFDGETHTLPRSEQPVVQVIAECLGEDFSVAGYRIKESTAKLMAAAPAHPQVILAELAKQFEARAAFNRDQMRYPGVAKDWSDAAALIRRAIEKIEI